MSLFTATAQAAVSGGQVGTVRRIVLSAATKVIQRAGFSSTRILGRGKDFSHAVGYSFCC